MKWLTILIPLVFSLLVCSPLKFKSQHWNRQPVHLFPPHTLQVCYQAVFLTPSTSLLQRSILSPLGNMLPIMNLVNMGAVKHPSDLLCTQVRPCSVHLHKKPSCCRAQRSDIHNSWPLADSCAPGHSGPDWQAEMTARWRRPQGEKIWCAMRS